MAEDREQDKRANTQSLFREVNERIEDLTRGRLIESEVLCECSVPDCTETIALTGDEYETVRSVPTRFLVVPGHVDSDIEHVVEETEHYVVVEKFGSAGARAAHLDPRRHEGEAAESP